MFLVSVVSSNAQVPITNGFTHNGSLSGGISDTWAFTADAGDAIVVRMGESVSGSSLYPYVRIFGTNGVLLASDIGSFAAEAVTRATNSGTFTIIAGNSEPQSPGGNGGYRITLSTTTTNSPLFVAPSDEGGTLTNGFTYQGNLSTGDLDVWSIVANSGDSLVVRLGELVGGSSLYPFVRVYGPNGALLDSDIGSSAAEVVTWATNSGTFTVVAANSEPQSPGGNGVYRLTLSTTTTNSPVVVAVSDEGGILTNGVTYQGDLPVGDMEVWTFSANAGDGIVVRLGETVSGSSLYPFVRIFGPNGALLDSDIGSFAAEVSIRATNSGTFTVVGANSEPQSPGGNGSYRLTLSTTTAPNPVIVASGDEGGTLTNGFTYQSDLPVGDMDVWSFTANSGDGIVVRLGEVIGGSSLYPFLRIYGPTGALLDSTIGSAATEVVTRATNSGIFTVVAANSEPQSPGGNGTYWLTMSTTTTNNPVVVASGDEGGTLTNGFTYQGALPVGDADIWSFTANSGDGIAVRLGEVVGGSSFYPFLRIYGPNGTLLDSNIGSSAAEVVTRATNSGTFTVVAANSEPQSPGGNGNYRLTLSTTTTGSPVVVAFADEGGTLGNGASVQGNLPIGDMDVWNFSVKSGDTILVRMGEVTNGSSLYPFLRIYGPNGALLNSTIGAATAEVFTRATNTGTFTVVAANSEPQSPGGNGTYRLTLAATTFGSPVVVSPGDEGGALTNGAVNVGAISTGDLDLWTFNACDGDGIVLQITNTSGGGFTPELRLYAPDGSLLNTVSSATAAQISRIAPALGSYTLIVGDSTTGAGTYQLTGLGVSTGFILCKPLISGTNLVVRSVGGSAGSNYVLFSTTNVALPQANWTPIRTNQFGAFGEFSATNAYSSGVTQQFFRVRTP